eukprot:COSAG03_NODE_243_length_10072_cov_11.712925_3_plen_67_part_00
MAQFVPWDCDQESSGSASADREALDAPNEYFYDAATHKLYVIPNATDGQPAAPDPKIRYDAFKIIP